MKNKFIFVLLLSFTCVFALAHAINAEETQEDPFSTDSPQELEVENEQEKKVTEEDLQVLRQELESITNERIKTESELLNNSSDGNEVSLWFNENSSNNISTLSLNIDYSSYSYLKIKYIFNTTTSNINQEVIINISEVNNNNYTTVPMIMKTGNLLYYRYATLSNNTIDISTGVRVTSSTWNTYNNFIIPIEIIGIKSLNSGTDCPVCPDCPTCPSCPDNPSGSTDLTEITKSVNTSNELLVSLNIGVISSFVGTVLFRVFKR